MFNSRTKEINLRKLKSAENKCTNLRREIEDVCVGLYEARKMSLEQIKDVEAFINTLVHIPKIWEVELHEVAIEVQEFKHAVTLEQQSKIEDFKNGSKVLGGVVVGVGVTQFGPTAALAVATTFGTASTGVAISSLSGAAATKAALAWLGGGAISAGGGGIVAGKSLLALAGPIGWAIGGGAVALGGMMASQKNREVAQQAQKDLKELSLQNEQLEVTSREIEALKEATLECMKGLKQALIHLKQSSITDYRTCTGEQKECLGALINNAKALSQLMNKRIE